MLIKLLFQKFIVYIMNNLCAKFGCRISSNSKDKQGGRNPPPPQALSASNHPGQIGLNANSNEVFELNEAGVQRSGHQRSFYFAITVGLLLQTVSAINES